MVCKTAAEVKAGSACFVMEKKEGTEKAGMGLKKGYRNQGTLRSLILVFMRFAIENGVTGVTLGCRSGKLV